MTPAHLVRALPFFAAVVAGVRLPAASPDAAYDSAIEPYVKFLKARGTTSPVDYVLKLFETYDLVVLCERAHPETTQYDLILDIIGDRRFNEKVGHVFTEIGVSTLESDVESFLMDRKLDEKAARERALTIYRDIEYSPSWEKTNYFDFLMKLQRLDRSLPQGRKVHLHPCDLPFTWKGMTGEKYKEFQRTLGDRDKIMAEAVVRKVRAIASGKDPRKKGLVIMNYRHAFPHFEISKGGRTKGIRNTCGYLQEAFPGKVANVMLNSIRILPGSSDQKVVQTAIQDGKWDAAFAVLGDRPAGFGFDGSPFGGDDFDYLPFPTGKSYADMFTGFIFFKPLKEHRMSIGVPGLVTPEFRKELVRRYELSGDVPPPQEVDKEIERLDKLDVFGYEREDFFGKSDLQGPIGKWLAAPASSRRSKTN